MAAMQILICLVLSAPSTGGQVARIIPRERVVEALVRGLEAKRYEQRQDACSALRRLGAHARPALERAAESEHAEVRHLSRRLLTDARLGIDAEWPSELAVQVRHFERLEPEGRDAVLQRLPKQVGTRAIPFLLERLQLDKEDADEAFSALMGLRTASEDAARRMIEGLSAPETLLEWTALARICRRAGRPVTALAASLQVKVLQDPASPAGKQMATIVERLAPARKYEEQGRFAEAAKALEVLRRPEDVDAEEKAPPKALKDIEGDLAAAVATLRKRAEHTKGRSVADEAGYGIGCTVTPVLKEGDPKALEEALADVRLRLSIRVEPEGPRILELPGVQPRFDPKQGLLQIRAHGVDLCEPVGFRPKENEAKVVATHRDRLHVFVIAGDLENVETVTRFDLDYRVVLKPGPKWKETTKRSVRLNGRPAPWGKLLGGLTLDDLPDEFELVVEGRSREGERVSLRRTFARGREVPQGP